MSWAAVAGAGIGAAGSIGSSLLNNSGEEKTVLSAARPTPQQQRIANEFERLAFGQFDPTYYLKNNPDLVESWNKNHRKKQISFGPDGDTIPDEAIQYATKHWNKWGKGESRLGSDPATTKTYEEKIAEDNAYQKGVDQKLIDDQSGTISGYKDDYNQTNQQKTDARTAQSQFQTDVTGNFIEQLKKNSGDYTGRLENIINPMAELANSGPEIVGYGGDGKPLYSYSGSQGYAKKMTREVGGDINTNRNLVAGQEYGANTDLLELIAKNALGNADDTQGMYDKFLGLDTGQNALENQINRIYTPNKDANDYQNWIQAENNRNDALRYGIPTTEGSADIGPGNFMPQVAGIMEIVNNIMKSKPPSTQPYNSGNNFAMNPITGQIEPIS